jgi:hypothetical protein
MKLTRLVGVAALSRLLPGLVGVTGGSTGGLVWFPANIQWMRSETRIQRLAAMLDCLPRFCRAMGKHKLKKCTVYHALG